MTEEKYSEYQRELYTELINAAVRQEWESRSKDEVNSLAMDVAGDVRSSYDDNLKADILREDIDFIYQPSPYNTFWDAVNKGAKR